MKLRIFFIRIRKFCIYVLCTTLLIAHIMTDPKIPHFYNTHIVCGASKIKLEKVNKMRTVTVRRVIIFLNISRRPLLICLHCKAVARAIAAIVLLTPAKNLNKVFWGVSSGLPFG